MRYEYAMMRQSDPAAAPVMWFGPLSEDLVWQEAEMVSAQEWCERWLREAIEDGFRFFFIARRRISDWERL